VLAAADETLAERGKLGVERVATVANEIELTASVMGGGSHPRPVERV
jgi:hypothetical protein